MLMMLMIASSSGASPNRPAPDGDGTNRRERVAVVDPTGSELHPTETSDAAPIAPAARSRMKRDVMPYLHDERTSGSKLDRTRSPKRAPQYSGDDAARQPRDYGQAAAGVRSLPPVAEP